MRNNLNVALAVAVLIGAAACSSTPVAAVRAAGVEHMQCDPSSISSDELARSLKVLSVEPVYATVGSAGSSEQRVNGAKLVVRPPRGVSAEQLTRTLQCHGARMVLGQINSFANDPYWLSDRWVNIDVMPENGNFTVMLSADTLRDNLQVYGHANQYAGEHMLATDPGLP